MFWISWQTVSLQTKSSRRCRISSSKIFVRACGLRAVGWIIPSSLLDPLGRRATLSLSGAVASKRYCQEDSPQRKGCFSMLSPWSKFRRRGARFRSAVRDQRLWINIRSKGPLAEASRPTSEATSACPVRGPFCAGECSQVLSRLARLRRCIRGLPPGSSCARA